MISRKYEGLSNVIGKEIQELRRKNKLSRAELSNKLMMLGIDINYDSIYKIENGRRIVKDFELAAIVKILGTTKTDILSNFSKNLK